MPLLRKWVRAGRDDEPLFIQLDLVTHARRDRTALYLTMVGGKDVTLTGDEARHTEAALRELTLIRTKGRPAKSERILD